MDRDLERLLSEDVGDRTLDRDLERERNREFDLDLVWERDGVPDRRLRLLLRVLDLDPRDRDRDERE
jgi:hypothetical protein